MAVWNALDEGMQPQATQRARSFAEGMRSGRIVVHKGAKPGFVSGSIVITGAKIEAARKRRTAVRPGRLHRRTGAEAVSSANPRSRIPTAYGGASPSPSPWYRSA